jgi:ComEC/Rec2-related protein
MSKFLNPSTIFLFLLTSVVILVSFWQIQINFQNTDLVDKNQTIEMRVVDSRKGFFGATIWYVWHENRVWMAETKDNLQIGREYKVLTTKQIFSSKNEKDNYELSLGVVGKLKIQKVISTNLNCDWLCLFIGRTKTFKLSLGRIYDQSFCHDWYFVVEFLAPKTLCSDISALSKGLILGGSDDFSKVAKDDLKRVGIIHIVVVSGFQVGLLASFLEYFGANSKLGRHWRFGLVILGLILMVVFVGFQPPVLRSIFSLLLARASLLFFGRKLETYRGLIYSAIIMLIINPFYLLSPSFQLSFLASFGLVVSLDSDFIKTSWLKNFAEIFVATVFTFLFTMPVIANLAGKISVVSLITNLLILPIIPILSGLNLLIFIPFVGQIFAALVAVIQSLMVFLIHDVSANFPPLEISEFSGLEVIIYYSLLLLVSFLAKNYLKIKSLNPKLTE